VCASFHIAIFDDGERSTSSPVSVASVLQNFHVSVDQNALAHYPMLGMLVSVKRALLTAHLTLICMCIVMCL